MSEDKDRAGRAAEHDEPSDEVEAHKVGGPAPAANVEASDETDSENEVEAHNKHRMA